MIKAIKIKMPVSDEVVRSLSIGDQLEISGNIFCGRDAVLPQVVKLLDEKGANGLGVRLQGGGPELRGRTGIIHQKRSAEIFLNTVIEWAKEEIKKLGCTPSTAAIGIGRSHTEAGMNMIKAMAYGDLSRQSPWEKRITDALNQTVTGPLGLGGKTTALGAFLKIGPLRASGFRSVTLRLGCCFEPRRGRLKILENNEYVVE
jgi:fumarate hydratase subunit alpha